jgi:type VI secretion system secreted protein Hcp
MTFKTQGKIKSSGKTGTTSSDGIPCQGFKAAEPEHDNASGLPSGKRKHNPVIVTREVDSASPKLFHACATGEVFSSALLAFPKSTTGGKPVKANTLELLNGAILKIAHAHSKNGKRWEAITLSFNEMRINGAPTSSLGVERYWWRDT